MRRTTIIIALLFVTLIGRGQEADLLGKVRQDFQKIDSEQDIDRILEVPLERSNNFEKPLIMAYQAAATCMKASYQSSPFSKVRYFNEGKAQLEELIGRKRQVENVYLRMMIQLNVPRLLNYRKNIEEDVAFLEANLPGADLDSAYKRIMVSNLKGSAAGKDLGESLERLQFSELD